MSILITEFMDEQAVAELRAQFKVVHKQDAFAMPELLVHELADAQALIVRNQTKVTEGLLNLAPRLKLVGRLGVGLDNIDLDACKARGIKVIQQQVPMLIRGGVCGGDCSACFVASSAMQGMRPKAGVAPNRRMPRGAGRKLVLWVLAIWLPSGRLAQGLGFECIGHDPF